MSNKTNQSVLVNDTSSYYLKQYAALQFPGSVDNFGTKTIDDKDYTTFSIATDPEAVKYLKAPLKNGGYSFEERKAFWDSFLDFKAPKLRLPVKIAKRSGCKL